MRETILDEMKKADRALEDLKRGIFAKKSADFDKEEMLLLKSLHNRVSELMDIVNFTMRSKDEQSS